jgi:cytochrome c553
LDAVTGVKLWQGHVNGYIHAAPITYLSQGKQFVTIASSKGIFTFALAREKDSLDGVTPLAGDPRLRREKATKCSQCHGLDGLGKLPIYPHLAGQSAIYLAKQLRSFRDGRRENSVMSPIAKNLSDADINDLAEYFSRIEIEVMAPDGIGRVGAGDVLDGTHSWLRVGDRNDAFLIYSSENQRIIRIDIQRAETDPWDVQLNLESFLVESESRYAVQFRARADTPRTIYVGFSQAHQPWAGLGLYRKVQLTSKWENFSLEFVATADEDNGRILFDAGDSTVSVEVSDVVLHSLSPN